MSFCLIRKYKKVDHSYVNAIISDATMEQVPNFFFAAVFSELTPQIAVVFIAIAYIFVGIPLKYCLIAVPLVIILIYIAIWMGHYFKAQELSTDLIQIEGNYLQDPQTCFWVAEVYGKSGEAELQILLNKKKKVEYDFYTEREFENMSLNSSGLSKTVTGCIAVTKSLHHANRGWIRRLAVKGVYRRRKIANHLLLEAIGFCQKVKYEGIDLVTTECHQQAKELYIQEGFKEIELTHKSFLGFGASQMSIKMYRPCFIKTNDTDREKDAVDLDKV